MHAFEMVAGEHFMWGDREMVAVTTDADAGTASLVYADTPTGPQVVVAADKLTHKMPPASQFSETVTTVEDMPGHPGKWQGRLTPGLEHTRGPAPCGMESGVAARPEPDFPQQLAAKYPAVFDRPMQVPDPTAPIKQPALYQRETEQNEHSARGHVDLAREVMTFTHDINTGEPRNWKPRARAHLAAALELLR